MRSWVATVSTLNPGGPGPMHMEFKYFKAANAVDAAQMATQMAVAALNAETAGDNTKYAMTQNILVTSLTDNGPSR